MKYLLIAIVILFILVIGVGRYFSISRAPASDALPVAYNLGVDFNDFYFSEYDLEHYNNKVFLESGDTVSGPGGRSILPHPTYILQPGTEILSITDGKVEDISYQKDHDDYSLLVSPSNSSWKIDYDHVTNIRVSKGDSVVSGQVLAESPRATGSLGEYNLGFMEIMVFQDSGPHGNNPTVCFFNFLDDSVKTELHAKIYEFVSEWEEFKGDSDIYNEELWESPGCIYNEINEGDTQ